MTLIRAATVYGKKVQTNLIGGIVAGLGALKHPATLSTDEQQKIENNVKMIEQTKSAAADAVNDAAAAAGK